jgi:hypothetical protein
MPPDAGGQFRKLPGRARTLRPDRCGQVTDVTRRPGLAGPPYR